MPCYYNYFDSDFAKIEWNYCCGNLRKEDKPSEKLKRDFERLQTKLKEDGFISIQFLCEVMGFESDNPYEFYCGDREKWRKALIKKLYNVYDEPDVAKQIIKVLNEEY